MHELLNLDFENGQGEYNKIGAINKNGQLCLGSRQVRGTDHNALSFKMRCMHCDYVYGANGTDVFQRKCPRCQQGAAGIAY